MRESLEALEYQCDVLVIGGGAAGCRAAIEAASLGFDVLLIDKGIFGHSGMSGALPNWLVSSPLVLRDSQEKYFDDLKRGSEFLANWKLAKILATEAFNRILELESYGNIFSRGTKGEPNLTQLAGHSVARTYAPAYLWMMSNEVRRRGARVSEETMITKLLLNNQRVVGATGIKKKSGEFCVFKAKSTILASGGGGQIYGMNTRAWQSTNPVELTGDGFAMAYMAGAELVDLEFIQFFLETLYPTRGGETVIGEALSRSRAYRSELTLQNTLAVHHFMGGLVIDEKCQTTIPGLFACGEVTGGIHSSSRLESNSLADCLVFGKRAGQFATKYASVTEKLEIDWKQAKEERQRIFYLLENQPIDGIRAHKIRRRLSNVMWHKVGALKDAKTMESAMKEIREIKKLLPKMYVMPNTMIFNNDWIEALETCNMVLTAEMVLKSSHLRRESRGTFRREDYPKATDKYLANIYVRKVRGKMSVYMKQAQTC